MGILRNVDCGCDLVGTALSMNYRRDNRMPQLFNFLKIAQKVTRR
jgi:hypothetical protein